MIRRRLAAAALCCALGAMLAGCEETASRVESGAGEVVSKVESGMKDAASKLESGASEAGSRVGSAAESLLEDPTPQPRR